MYYEGWYSPSTLQHVEINYVDRDTCDDIYGGSGSITSSMMCAGEQGKDGCQGDSGKRFT